MRFDRLYSLPISRYAIVFAAASLAGWGIVLVVLASIFTGISLSCQRAEAGDQGRCDVSAGSFFATSDELEFTVYGTTLSTAELSGGKVALQIQPLQGEPLLIGAVKTADGERIAAGFNAFASDTKELRYEAGTGFPLFWFLLTLPLVLIFGLIPAWLSSGGLHITVSGGNIEVERLRPFLPARTERWAAPDAPAPRFSVYQYEGNTLGALLMTQGKKPEVLVANLRLPLLRRMAAELQASWKDGLPQ